MNTAGPTGPSNSPNPGLPHATDAQLSAQLKKWTGATPAFHPVGELLDRHWAAAFAYARLCTDSGRAAGMLTTAAFTRLFGEALRQDGPSSAWRPHLLVTVGRIAVEWDADGRRELLHPALRTADDSPQQAAAGRLLPPPHRRTLSQAFQRLPQTARCVLWHAEVEAEPPVVPAGLLGLDEEDVRLELRRARERLRAEVLQVHRESAPEEECRRFLRLLDVTLRRGGTVTDPDLHRHLDRCGPCRYTADQLAQFDGALGFALAEAVLGWAARAYVTARLTSALGEGDGEAPPAEASDAAVGYGATESGRHATGPRPDRPSEDAGTPPEGVGTPPEGVGAADDWGSAAGPVAGRGGGAAGVGGLPRAGERAVRLMDGGLQAVRPTAWGRVARLTPGGLPPVRPTARERVVRPMDGGLPPVRPTAGQPAIRPAPGGSPPTRPTARERPPQAPPPGPGPRRAPGQCGAVRLGLVPLRTPVPSARRPPPGQPAPRRAPLRLTARPAAVPLTARPAAVPPSPRPAARALTPRSAAVSPTSPRAAAPATRRPLSPSPGSAPGPPTPPSRPRPAAAPPPPRPAGAPPLSPPGCGWSSVSPIVPPAGAGEGLIPPGEPSPPPPAPPVPRAPPPANPAAPGCCPGGPCSGPGPCGGGIWRWPWSP
ncbi:MULTISPECIES: hydrolase [Streptomyces]|uniref:Hydrolase n=1 Tax=Streptomyces griseosporeus TaxID=1910 RepID=A0ABV3KWR8_STRGS|nr:hydrolase [Streptomyces actuosus]